MRMRDIREGRQKGICARFCCSGIKSRGPQKSERAQQHFKRGVDAVHLMDDGTPYVRLQVSGHRRRTMSTPVVRVCEASIVGLGSEEGSTTRKGRGGGGDRSARPTKCSPPSW